MQGVCNIDFSKSYFCRQTDFHPLENNIFITKQKISLPVIVTANDDVKGNYKELDRLEKEAKGIWKIISVNPDSIQIEVSKSILNGKYSVIFKKNQKENEKLNYYIILKNDSTYMVCTKEILNFKNKVIKDTPIRVVNDSTNETRELYWDEENQLMVLSDNGKTSRYTYNAAGERIMKSYGTMEGVFIYGAS